MSDLSKNLGAVRYHAGRVVELLDGSDEGSISEAASAANVARAERRGRLEMPGKDIDDPNLLMVGEASGKPGDVVTVEVLGQTNRPVNGFGAFIGCRKQISLVGSSISQELQELTGLEELQHGISQKKGDGIEGYISIYCAFFGKIKVDLSSSDEEIEAETDRLRKTESQAVIPPKTPLAVLRFHIPESATPGDHYLLDNTPNKYGYYWRDHQGKRHTVRLQASYSVARGQGKEIRPTCLSGGVYVV